MEPPTATMAQAREIMARQNISGLPIVEYTPAAIKASVVGHGRADKHQMQRMVRTLLSLPAEPDTSHEADALAVAICHVTMPPLARLAS